MPIATFVPGMKPGRLVRNSLIGATYLLLLTVVLPVARVSYRPYRGC